MKKGNGSYIGILLLASALLSGCSHSTQVTNNTTNSAGPWVVTNTDPTVPLTIIDSLGESLSAIQDTSANTIIGCVFTDSKNDTAEIWISDSALPSKAVVGNYEFLFTNYTDTSVDIVVTDTNGDIGIAQNMDVRTSLQASSIHSNKLGIAFKKGGAIPSDLTTTLSEIAGTIIQIFNDSKCAWAAEVAVDEVVTVIETTAAIPGGILATPLTALLPAIGILGSGCQSAFLAALPKILELIKQIGTSNPPPAPPNQQSLINADKPWEAANSLDQYISNKAPFTFIAWSAKSANGLETMSGACQGSGGTSDGVSTFSGTAASGGESAYINTSQNPGQSAGFFGGGYTFTNTIDCMPPNSCPFLCEGGGCSQSIFSNSSVIFGTFSGSLPFSVDLNGFGNGTISGSFKINK